MTDGLRSTALRLAGLYGLAFALVAAALGYTIYAEARDELLRQLDARIVAEQRELIRSYDAGGLPALTRDVTTRAAHGGPSEMRYSILGPTGRLSAGAPVAAPVAAGWSDVDFRYGTETADPARALTAAMPGGSRLVVGADSDSIERIHRRMTQLFVLAFGAMILIAMAGGLALSATLRQRINTIGRTARAIVEGDLGHRIPIRGSRDEFDRLSATLNAMLDRIGALMGSLHQVSSDIAHDLRTPLSRLRQKLELAMLSEDDASELRTAITAAIDQTDEILSLFGAILDVSEIEARTPRLRFHTVALSALVTEVAESFVGAAEDGGRALSWHVTPGIEIEGDRGLLAQLLVNLLDNALTHGSPGAKIAVHLETGKDGPILIVADDGPGIARAEREAVFKRFYRLERSRSTAGHGLGLSLVAAVARAHGASVALTDNRPGVRITVTFK